MAKLLLNEGSAIETIQTKEEIIDLIKAELAEEISTNFISVGIKSCILKGDQKSRDFWEGKETLINLKRILFIY